MIIPFTITYVGIEKSKKTKIKQLEKANIHSIEDMVKFLPKKMIDCNNPKTSFKEFYGIDGDVNVIFDTAE